MHQINIEEFEKRFWYVLNKFEPDFKITKDNKSVIDGLIKYFYGDESSPYKLSKGLVIYGNTGSGKTIIMKSFHYLCNHSKINPFDWYLCPELQMDFEHNNGLKNFKQYIKRPACFDELEGDKKEKIYGKMEDSFGRIFHIRNEYGIKTYVTMNDRPKDFKDFFGPKIDSRKHTLFNEVLLKSEIDYRTTK